jgi:carboxylesterase type B
MKKSFTGNFSAKKNSPECIQFYQGNVINPKGLVSGSEDCLTCNIYTPMVLKIKCNLGMITKMK